MNGLRSGSWSSILPSAKECILEKIKGQGWVLFYVIRGMRENISPGGYWGEGLGSHCRKRY